MKFEEGKWYKTSDRFEVEFIVPIEKDGMYNVFRYNAGNGYNPYYTDVDGNTAYGTHILISEK